MAISAIIKGTLPFSFSQSVELKGTLPFNSKPFPADYIVKKAPSGVGKAILRLVARTCRLPENLLTQYNSAVYKQSQFVNVDLYEVGGLRRHVLVIE